MRVRGGEHVSVLGTTGTGKTYWVKNALLPAFSRVIIVDTEDFDFPEFPSVNLKRALALARSQYSFAVRVIFDPDDTTRLSVLCDGLLEGGHDLVVYFDEITDFSTPTTIPTSLQRLIRKARKRGVSVVVGTQRPQMLNKAFLANSQHRVYFHLSDYDRAAVRDYAPWLAEEAEHAPYGSYRCIYESPDGERTVLSPTEKYDWRKRNKR